MPVHNLAIQANADGLIVSKNNAVESNTEVRVGMTLGANTTNYALDVVISGSIKSVIISAGLGDLTIKTNNSGSPTDTISLDANGVLVWSPSDQAAIGATNPFGNGAVSVLFLTSVAGTKFDLRVLLDTTD